MRILNCIMNYCNLCRGCEGASSSQITLCSALELRQQALGISITRLKGMTRRDHRRCNFLRSKARSRPAFDDAVCTGDGHSSIHCVHRHGSPKVSDLPVTKFLPDFGMRHIVDGNVLGGDNCLHRLKLPLCPKALNCLYSRLRNHYKSATKYHQQRWRSALETRSRSLASPRPFHRRTASLQDLASGLYNSASNAYIQAQMSGRPLQYSFHALVWGIPSHQGDGDGTIGSRSNQGLVMYAVSQETHYSY